MNSRTHLSRSRGQILADIHAIGNIVEGTLTLTHQKPDKNGIKRPHYHLQKWKNGKNNTVYVPLDKVEAVKKGIENRKRLQALMDELFAAETLAALDPEPPRAHDPAVEAKKKRRKSSSPSPAPSAKPSPTRSRMCRKTESTAR